MMMMRNVFFYFDDDENVVDDENELRLSLSSTAALEALQSIMTIKIISRKLFYSDSPQITSMMASTPYPLPRTTTTYSVAVDEV